MKIFFMMAIGKPLYIVAKFIFKHILVDLYRLYFNFKKWLTAVLAPAKNKIIYPLLNKSTLHLVLILITMGVIVNNFVIKETRAQEFSQKTILASMVTDEDQADIVETAAKDTTAKTKTSYQTVGMLNPSSGSATATPVDSSNNTSQIMTTTSSAAVMTPSANSATAASQPRDEVVYYLVEGGDTISTIAEKFGVSTNTILWENKLGPRDLIKPSDKLTILPVSGVSHQVKKGDTVEKIAQRYSVNANDIIDYNQLADMAAIEQNEILIVPGGTMPEEVKTAPSKTSSTASKFALIDIPPSSRVSSSARLLWPTPSHRINQYYKWRHTGLDIDGDYSSPLYAADDGRVEYAASDRSGYGLHIIINHGGGTKTLYGHASKIFVKVGDSVKRGQTIGMVGCTGRCTGTHLHFEVIINGKKQNPLSYI